MPINGKTIAYCIVDTLNPAAASMALEYSVARFPVDQIYIFTDQAGSNQWAGREVIEIATIQSIKDYCEFVVNKMPSYVETDFVITLQYDGFVIHPEEFSPHFLHYDYIGAPWPHIGTHNVGNGGFSWRSKKLLDAASQFAYLYNIQGPEDYFISRNARVYLEDRFGIRYAPQPIASHFSIEFEQNKLPTFGFHGVHLLKHVPEFDLALMHSFLSPLTQKSVKGIL